MSTTTRAPPVSEAAFQRALVELLRLHGWRLWHNTIAWRSDAGFPDLVCCHPSFGLRFIECKRDDGRVTPAQKSWIADLRVAGAIVHVLRPIDLYLADTAERIARGEA